MGANDRLLARVPLSARGFCGGSAALAVRGTVPLSEVSRRLVIRRTDFDVPGSPLIVADITVPTTAPDVRFVGAPQWLSDKRVSVSWQASGDPPPVEFRLVYSHTDGRTWIPC